MGAFNFSMRYPFLGFCLLIFWLSCQHSYGQHAIAAGGGDITGSGGHAAYTVGLTSFEFYAGQEGSISLGVQHPVSGVIIQVEDHNRISIDIFPNPSKDVVNIQSDYSSSPLTVSLIDMNGAVLMQKEIYQGRSMIPVDQFAAGGYLLTISAEGSILKTCKIIKSN